MQQAAQDARLAAQKLATFTEGDKNAALRRIQGALSARIPEIRRANATDVANMTDDNAPLKKRLVLDDAKIDSLIRGIDQVIALPDPVGKVDYANELQEGLELFRVSCPIGVLGIIFEARPEAAVQITCLSIKSGNAVLLKGGKEARESNRVLVQIMTEAIMGRPEQNLNWPTGVVQNLDSRDEVNAMLKMDKYIDLIIPRGSNQVGGRIVLGACCGAGVLWWSFVVEFCRDVVGNGSSRSVLICNEQNLPDKLSPSLSRTSSRTR